MINKVLPRKLNKSSDSRIRAKDEMLDALNVVVTEEFNHADGSKSNGMSGNLGVIKPSMGNVLIQGAESSDLPDSEYVAKVIGSCPDNNIGVLYLAVWSQNAKDHGIYAYDPDGVLPGADSSNVMRRVFTHQQFNFPQNGFVKIDVVHTGNEIEIDGKYYDRQPILYLTDNKNEPRKVNVINAMTTDFSDYDTYDIADFITACPKAPLYPPTFEFMNDQSRIVSHFEGVSGVQFSYQAIYRDGTESAMSTYSKIAIPTSYLNQGTNSSPEILFDNKCQVTIPSVDMSKEVVKVRLLAREGNNGNFFSVDEINFNGEDVVYDFYNDRIVSVVPQEDVDKHFDNLPRIAQAQAVLDNRLFYANYVEGFDNVEVSADIEVKYDPRPADFAEIDLEVSAHIFFNETSAIGGTNLRNRSAGFYIDMYQLPEFIPGNTTINFSMTVAPDNNWNIYSAKGESYHSNRWLFPSSGIYGADEAQGLLADNSYNSNQTISGRFRGYQPGLAHLNSPTDLQNKGRVPLFGINNGVSVPYRPPGVPFSLPKWNVTAGPFAGDQYNVTYGTSAANPLIIKGGAVTFDFSVKLNSGINRQEAKAIVIAILTGSDVPGDAELISSNVNPSYSFDLGLDASLLNVNQDTGQLQPLNIPADLSTKEITDLIVAVGVENEIESNLFEGYYTDNSESENPNTDETVYSVPPIGYFLVDKASVGFKLRSIDYPVDIDPVDYENDVFVIIEIDSIDNVSVKTAIPFTYGEGNMNSQYSSSIDGVDFYPKIKRWVITDQSVLQEYPETGFTINIEGDIGGGDDPIFYNQFIFNEQGFITGEGFSMMGQKSIENRQKMTGYLDLSGAKLMSTRSDIEEVAEIANVSVFADRIVPSLVDGQSGPSGAFLNENFYFGSISPVAVLQGLINNRLMVSNSQFTNGGSFYGSGYYRTLFPHNSFYPYFVGNDGVLDNPLLYDNGNNGNNLPEIEVLSSYTYSVEGDSNFRSFKTKAIHDFGIVYYDQRGRSGGVNYLGNAYVGGYSPSERYDSNTGRAYIDISLLHSPPSWAHYYQIVYSGNRSVNDFIQYTAGGAFISSEDSSEDNNIYVSLNYLQGNTNVSYTDSFGAINEDASQNMYNFSKGDKLRIVSYYSVGGIRIFPYNYEFEIIDLVTLGSESENNILVDSGEVPAAKQGQFLVLKNNPSATDFTYADVKSGNNEIDTNAHKWNNRCVFEIYTPSKIRDFDDRAYYEISEVYRVVLGQLGGVAHEQNQVRLNNGDVWWKRMPVNLPEYNDNEFANIIQDEESNPIFRPYFLETNTFSDMFPNNRVFDWGKPKFILSDSSEVRRRSSVTFSDKNNYATRFNRYTSFNQSKSNFKDLPNDYGSINFILNNYDSLFVIQEGKCSAYPIQRNIITDASGSDQLVISSDIIGTGRFYAGDYGCDNNPESVVKVDTNIYFADKSKGEVYRFNESNGLTVISKAGMSNFIYNMFMRANESEGDVRVVGGYDPLNDEFLITVINQDTLSYIVEPEIVTQTEGKGELEEEGDGGNELGFG